MSVFTPSRLAKASLALDGNGEHQSAKEALLAIPAVSQLTGETAAETIPDPSNNAIELSVHTSSQVPEAEATDGSEAESRDIVETKPQHPALQDRGECPQEAEMQQEEKSTPEPGKPHLESFASALEYVLQHLTEDLVDPKG